MAKRALTRQQKWRIEKIQQERIDRANKKTCKLEQQLEADYQLDLSHQYHGLVIKNYGQSLDIESNNKLYRCSYRQNLGAIVAGDRVIWHKLQTHKHYSSKADSKLIYDGVVNAVKPRKSLLARPDSYGNKKTVAANIDQILIINAPTSVAIEADENTIPRLNNGLIDRYLVSAESNQIKAVIVINKIDLLSDKELADIKSRLEIYKQLKYEIIYTNALKQQQQTELSGILSNKNSIFVGQSGVGKSSLLNYLLPHARAKTASVSTANAKGRHTTSAAQLYHLEQAGIENATLIDSPGIREFGLWDISKNDIDNGFKEIKEYSANCRFRNCQHDKEPDCAILKAIDEKLISPLRFNSYKKLIGSLTTNS